MADRSGYPEVDAVIEEFLRVPMGDWTTDDDPIEALRDPSRAHGVCEEVAEQFVEFAKQRGFRAYATHADLDELGYKTQGEPHGDVLDAAGELRPGFYEQHTVASIYLDGERFPIVVDFTAAQYGYSDHPKVTT